MEYVPPYGSTNADESYADINQATATEGSTVPAAAIEHPMREIMAVINAAGLTPNAENLSQLLEAMQILFIAVGTPLRTRLTANTTYYVATTGSDTTGTGAIDAPWKTRQKAWDYIQRNLDLNGYSVTIQHADGTYNDVLICRGNIVGSMGSGYIIIQGNTTTPSNVVSATISVQNFPGVSVQYMKMACTGDGLVAVDGKISVGPGMVFGTCTGGTHIGVGRNATIELGYNYTINGGAAQHFDITGPGEIYTTAAITVTLSGTPAFGTFAMAMQGGVISFMSSSLTWSGSATGTRYSVTANAVINVGGAGVSYFPGNVAGAAPSSGGQYI